MATTYHKTSVDCTTILAVGRKRSLDEFQGIQKAPTVGLTDTVNRESFRCPLDQESSLNSLTAGAIRDVALRTQESAAYPRRGAIALTSALSSDPLLSLSHPAYGLPLQLVENLASLGVNSIYPWRQECLLRSGALHGRQNLVYTAPTGGGKSLVGDIIMLKKVIEDPLKKALLVLPYVALVQEKLRSLRQIVEGIEKVPPPYMEGHRSCAWTKRGDKNAVRIAGFFGGIKSRATWADMDIAVCTIEKANHLVNAAIEDSQFGNIGVVVMDELHMLGDGSRGHILELMATKLLCLEEQVQLVGMSATLKNTELLAKCVGKYITCISRALGPAVCI